MSDAAPSGFVVVDKPGGWTSHDVVGRLRRLAGTRRVGHAGTLDPMATGVLVLGVGSATRLLTFAVGSDKAYDGTVRLGVATTTDDAEGEVLSAPGAAGLDAAEIEAVLNTLRGTIEQVPSAVSAIKVGGVRSYARVRAGEQVELAPREVTVRRLEVVGMRATRGPEGLAVVDVDIQAEVSSGTYIRALARDLGRRLGTGGHLTALRRTQVGQFTLADAHELGTGDRPGLDVAAALLAPAVAAERLLPRYDVTADEAQALRHGRRPRARTDAQPGTAAAIDPDGALVAVVEVTDGSLRPTMVLPG